MSVVGYKYIHYILIMNAIFDLIFICILSLMYDDVRFQMFDNK